MPGKRRYQYVPDYVVFDLETTGISPERDAIIEISAIKVRKGKIEDEFSSLVYPERKIPKAASAVNGITDVMVANAPTIAEIFPDFLCFVGEDVLVGHNIHTFDMKFLRRDGQRLGMLPENDYIDTLTMARKCLPELSHHRLTDLAEYYQLSTDGAHRALNDCRMNQEVFERLHLEMQKHPERLKTVKQNPVSAETGSICPQCGQVLKKRTGMYGEFWGCSGFPRCRFTANIK